MSDDPVFEPEDDAPASRHMLRMQREANTELILSGLRAQQDTEDAIHGRRVAEEDATSARESELDLRAVGELRERLIGILGHDLRNPLNTILMASAVLDGDNLSPKQARAAGVIATAGQRMSRMIDQLVAFTRARMGGVFELTLAPADVGHICSSIAEELRVSSSAEITVTSHGDLAGTWDVDRLAEVVSNIAGNAVEHATPGTPITIHARQDGGEIEMDITNLGPTIPPDVLPRIFDAFRRADEVSRPNTNHLGLGLYIACEIVRAHGGSIRVRSADGATTFTIRLPKAPPDQPS